MISVIDDSENLKVFFYDVKMSKVASSCAISIMAKKHDKDFPLHNMVDKHLFGMGYPYFITGYNENVAFSTDYGILLFKVNPKQTKTSK